MARSLFRNEIFTDLHIPEPQPQAVLTVFMPLALGGLHAFPIEELEKIGLIYEFMDKASPRSVNGLPTFMSFSLLNKEDTRYVLDKAAELQTAEEKIMGESNGAD